MEVNDNPNLEHGIEDQVGKDEIWVRAAQVVRREIRAVAIGSESGVFSLRARPSYRQAKHHKAANRAFIVASTPRRRASPISRKRN